MSFIPSIIHNNPETSRYAVLKDGDGHPVPLKSIVIDGTIGDVFSRVTVTQIYQNTEEKNIEAVYSFPLPLDGILLDFTVTIDGKIRHGTVMKKRQARQRYEDAVEQGNSAAMLEQIGDGLYSMSVGNLLSGQTIEIAFSYSEFNIWNGKLLRFFLPSVVAPKFGDPGKSGIDLRQAPVTSMEASNPMKCTLKITGSLAAAAVTCPTHHVEQQATGEGLLLSVSAFADRDFILEIRKETDPSPLAVTGRDHDGYVAAVAMTPDFGDRESHDPRDIDIVVDCSGSMSGESIKQARQALGQILDRLRKEDSFNIIRFGSEVVPLFPEHMPVSEESLERSRTLLRSLDADLGGTNLEGALEAAYKTHIPGRQHDILLITDGQVYESESFYQLSQQSGSRIFTVGVGTAVSEGLLRKLSRITGGMAEFVTPNENMAEKIVRHFQRMSLPASAAEIVWPAEPDWIWPVGAPSLFHGDTAVFFARFPAKPEGRVELKASSPAGSFSWAVDLPEDADETECSDLARMAVRRRIAGRTDDQAAEQAVKYRLITPLTNYLLVEENQNRDELALPELRTVPQMAPSGFVGIACFAAACFAAPAFPAAASMAGRGMTGVGMMGMASANAMGMGGMMAMNRAKSAMKSAAPDTAAEDAAEPSADPASGSASSTGGQDSVAATGSSGELEAFALSLCALDLAGIKNLFSAKTVDALVQEGLPAATAGTLRAMINDGCDERIVFILFLNRLMAGYASRFAGTPAGEFITRSHSRLSDGEKSLPSAQQALLEGIFSGN